jgi:hypothetical protein
MITALLMILLETHLLLELAESRLLVQLERERIENTRGRGEVGVTTYSKSVNYSVQKVGTLVDSLGSL